jgi:hypothetical protein
VQQILILEREVAEVEAISGGSVQFGVNTGSTVMEDDSHEVESNYVTCNNMKPLQY